MAEFAIAVWCVIALLLCMGFPAMLVWYCVKPGLPSLWSDEWRDRVSGYQRAADMAYIRSLHPGRPIRMNWGAIGWSYFDTDGQWKHIPESEGIR